MAPPQVTAPSIGGVTHGTSRRRDAVPSQVGGNYTIPTIFITAHGGARTHERVKQSGVAEFRSKPFGDQALLDLIRRAICPA